MLKIIVLKLSYVILLLAIIYIIFSLLLNYNIMHLQVREMFHNNIIITDDSMEKIQNNIHDDAYNNKYLTHKHKYTGRVLNAQGIMELA
mgnify:CR=1 FL=1